MEYETQESEMGCTKHLNLHSFFYKNNFIRTRASYLTKS